MAIVDDVEEGEIKVDENFIESENFKKQLLDIIKEYLSDENKEKKARYSTNEYMFIVKANTFNEYLQSIGNVYAVTTNDNEKLLKEFEKEFNFKDLNTKENLEVINKPKFKELIRIKIGNHKLHDNEIEYLGFICIDEIQASMAVNIIKNSISKDGKGIEELIKFTQPMIEATLNNSTEAKIINGIDK